MHKFSIIDSIRALCAVWVFMGHAGGLPVMAASGIDSELMHFLRSLNGILFDGVAAVICFFIISGICIHAPLKGKRLEVGPYLVRRMTRVCIPFLCALSLAKILFGTVAFLDAVLWSLYCELIFYSLYPALRWIAKRTGWLRILFLSYCIAFAIACTDDNYHGNFWAYGIAWTWVLGLPIWLTGVWIAEAVRLDCAPPDKWALRGFRCVIWMLSSLALMLHFHTEFTYKFSMLIFAFPAAIWIVLEIRAGRDTRIYGWTEAMGAWSFSLYLCHKFSIEACSRNCNRLSASGSVALLDWALTMLAGLLFSFLFYLLIERPSHALARRIARRMPMVVVID